MIDFRISAIKGGGLVTRYTNRNDLEGSKAKKTKYPTIVKTNEDLEREEEEKKAEEMRKMHEDIENMNLGPAEKQKGDVEMRDVF